MNSDRDLEPTRRFSSRVGNYVKYRPDYPPEVLETLRRECGLKPEWPIADIGSGTGILTEVFLKNGNRVYGVEPNRPMREAAEALLAKYPNFVSVDGTAEETGLPDSSVQMITAAQAFHWFDRVRAKAEFPRILRPGGWVVLVWNERRAGTPFLDAYEELLRKYAPEYGRVDHGRIDERSLGEFFAPAGYHVRSFDNAQTFDYEGLKGRLMSSSYAPLPGQPQHEEMVAELRGIFERCRQAGRVLFEYDTRVHFGEWGSGESTDEHE